MNMSHKTQNPARSMFLADQQHFSIASIVKGDQVPKHRKYVTKKTVRRQISHKLQIRVIDEFYDLMDKWRFETASDARAFLARKHKVSEKSIRVWLKKYAEEG